MLFYSLPILKEVADPTLVEYWSLYVRGMYISLSTNISFRDLIKIHEMLMEFGIRTEMYFGIFEMTFTLHEVVEHFASQVLNWGPLCATSCFAFESTNRYILRAINSPIGGVNMQILQHLNLCHTVLELEKKVLSDAPEIHLLHYEQISSRKSEYAHSIGENKYFGSMVLEEAEERVVDAFLTSQNYDVNMLLSSILVFNRLLKNNYLFGCASNRNEKTDFSCTTYKRDYCTYFEVCCYKS